MIKKGDKVICIGNRNLYRAFPDGWVTEALADEESGIFEGRTYLNVRTFDGGFVTLHASRFKVVKNDQN